MKTPFKIVGYEFFFSAKVLFQPHSGGKHGQSIFYACMEIP
jgi:hypothetical protein